MSEEVLRFVHRKKKIIIKIGFQFQLVLIFFTFGTGLYLSLGEKGR